MQLRNRYAKLTAALAMISLVAGGDALAQLPVSRAVYVYPVSVTGGNTVTAIGVPFLQETIVRDVVAGVASPVITGVNGGYPILGANTHMVLIITGPSRGLGLPIVSSTATTVTVAGTIPLLVANSDEFEIVPLVNLNSQFGGVATGGLHDLTGAPAAGGADKVIVNGISYFYKTAGANAPAWKLESAPNAVGDLGTTTLANLRGVLVRRVGAAVDVGVRGVCRVNCAGIPVPNGVNLLSWPIRKTPVTLLQSGLQNSITGAPAAGAADKVIINGVNYFYKTAGANAPGWKLESSPNAVAPGADNVVLNAGGKAFLIRRLGAETVHYVLQP